MVDIKKLISLLFAISVLLLNNACSTGKPVKPPPLNLRADIDTEYSEDDGTQINIDIYSSVSGDNGVKSLIFMPPVPFSSRKQSESSFYLIFAFHSKEMSINIDPSKFGLSFINKNLHLYPGGSYGPFHAEDEEAAEYKRACRFRKIFNELTMEIGRESSFLIPSGSWSCIALKYNTPTPDPSEEFYLYIDGVFSNSEKVNLPLIKFKQGSLYN